MRYFDLHCDTLYRALTENKSIYKNDFHISIERGLTNKPWIQCFAIWIPDEIRGKNAFELVDKAYSLLQNEVTENENSILLCKTTDDLTSVCKEKSAGAIFTIEGSASLGNDIENLDRFKDMGVKAITLTWNGECEIGSGIEAEQDKGITPFGVKVLSKMEELGIVADVSHASEKLFFDVAQLSHKPFIATHSNSKQICNHKRNLTNEQFITIKERNGLVGLTFCRKFLNNIEEKAKTEDIVYHAEHFLSLGGENILSLGGDFDGADIPSDMVGIESVYNIAECFLRLNYKEELVNKILFDNAYNFFTNL